MTTILCVSHVCPWPARHGNELRLQRLLGWMRRRGYRVILVLTASDVDRQRTELTGRHVDRLELPCQTTLPGRIRRLLARWRAWCASRLSGRHPVGGPHDGGGMRQLADVLCPADVRRLVRRVTREEPVDIHVAFYAFALPAFGHVERRETVICDTVEAFSMPRHDPDGSPIAATLSVPRDEERSMLLGCGQILAIQRVEAEYFAGLVPERPVATVGMDHQVPASAGPPSAAPERIGIIGSPNRANVDGLRLFLAECWPMIARLAPDGRLWIAGQLGAAIRTHLADALPEGVETIGNVEDVADFYRQVRVVVNPVRGGTGLKIKSIEALAHGRPVVTFPIGCEGIEPGAERALWVCERPDGMATACATLLRDPAACDRMGAAAREFAATALAADHVYAPLARIIDTLTGRRADAPGPPETSPAGARAVPSA